MKTLLALSLLSSLGFASGCATTGGVTDRDVVGAHGAHLTLDATSPDDAARTFPERTSRATLPAADRIAQEIAVETGGSATAEVKLCVAADGRVDRVDLLKGSGFAAYDQAVVDGVRAWTYAASPAPSGVHTCERLNVWYQVK